MIRRTLFVLVFILAIAAGLIWGYIIGALTPLVYTDKNVMEAICDYSSTVRSGEWEDACGLAQDVSGEAYK